MVQIDVRGVPGRSKGVPGSISALNPRSCHEMASELVSGADFWCKLISGGPQSVYDCDRGGPVFLSWSQPLCRSSPDLRWATGGGRQKCAGLFWTLHPKPIQIDFGGLPKSIWMVFRALVSSTPHPPPLSPSPSYSPVRASRKTRGKGVREGGGWKKQEP